MKKIIFFLLMTTILLTSCKEGDGMTRLDTLLVQVENSNTSEQEEKALFKVAEFIGEEGYSIKVSVTIDGEQHNLQEANNLDQTEEAEIIFFYQQEERKFIWKPKDISNIFVLYRE